MLKSERVGRDMTTERNNSKALMTCHFVIMGILAVFNAVSMVMLIKGPSNLMYPILGILLYAFLTLALVFGIIYLRGGYRKQYAVFYKLFLFFLVVGYLCGIVSTILEYGPNFATIIQIIWIAGLLILAFWSNLGKRDSWILYAVLFVLQIIWAISAVITSLNLFKTLDQFSGTALIFTMLAAVFSRLLLLGSVGLALKGKYDDKDARGTI